MGNDKTMACSVCAGTGKPLSERPCICGGSGTAEAETQGLRERVQHLEVALEPLAHALDGLRYEPKGGDDIGRMNYDTGIKPIHVEVARATLGIEEEIDEKGS